jgi:hypothetical protein
MKWPGRPVSNPAKTIDVGHRDAVWLSKCGRRPMTGSSRHRNRRNRRIGNRDSHGNRGIHGNRRSRALPG